MTPVRKWYDALMRPHFPSLLAFSALLLTAACGDESITRARVPKSEEAPAAMGGMPQDEHAGHDHSAHAAGLKWTLPSGWKETAGTGIGLSNIRERLALLYGNKASLTVTEPATGGTSVTITLPYAVHTSTET